MDLVELDRVADALARWGERLVNRLMDPAESARLPGPAAERARSLALAIAGKEAASKAIGTGWSRGVRWRDVVVEPGPPVSITLFARAIEVARSLGSSGRTWAELEVREGLVLAQVRLLS